MEHIFTPLSVVITMVIVVSIKLTMFTLHICYKPYIYMYIYILTIYIYIYILTIYIYTHINHGINPTINCFNHIDPIITPTINHY